MIRVELSKITNGEKRKQKFNLAYGRARERAQNFIDGVHDYKYEWWESDWAEIDENTDLEDIIEVAQRLYQYEYVKYKVFQELIQERMEAPIDLINAIDNDKILVLDNSHGPEHKNYHQLLGEYAFDIAEVQTDYDAEEVQINEVPLTAYIDYQMIGNDFYTEEVFYHRETSEELIFRMV